MQELDNEFFESYKRLDRLCSDIYGCRNGVSLYIKDMERTPYQDQPASPTWTQAYKTLKHLRWVRNQIAHDPGPVQICEASDIQAVNSFYNDIMFGRDPLTQLRRYREASTAAKTPVRPTAAPAASGRRPNTARPAHRRIGILFAAALIMIGISAIFVYLLTSLL